MTTALFYVLAVMVLVLSLNSVVDSFNMRSKNLHVSSAVDLRMSFFNFDFGGSSSNSKQKPVCVITGTTSGLGLECSRALLKSGKYQLVLANRDVDKMKSVAAEEGFDDLPGQYTVMPLDLGSFQSTKNFVKLLKAKFPKPLERLVCNAAVYQPANLEDQDEKGVGRPKFTSDNIEQQLQINHLSHFLLCNLLLGDMTKAAKGPVGARMIVVGSITGNDNTVGGGLVYPVADLGDLKGMALGSKNPVSMIDGESFNGAKAYKDSKVCNMMTINELHKRYHKSTGITFSTMYPGCIAETQLFRQKRVWFQKLFPVIRSSHQSECS